MHYFDCNCRLGRYNDWSGAQPITREDLLRVMDHYGIQEALLLDNLASEYHPIDGNARILETTVGEPRLHPAWVGLPPASRELPPPEQLVAQMAERGVGALYLFPRQYHFTLDGWSVDALLGPLAERRVPVFICPNGLMEGPGQDQTDWPGVVRICRAFPSLPVIVSERRISYTLRTVYQALETCPNLHLDLASLWLHHIIEFIAREWGAERLLFGSGLPERDPGAVLGHLNYADIADADKEAIAGGNLRRLLSWNPQALARQPEPHWPAPLDELHALARSAGSLRGQRFHDSHGHLGRHFLLHIPDNSAEELIAEMDRTGIERAIIFTNGGITNDEVYGNALVAAAAQAHPERFVGFVTISLNRPADEVRRIIAEGFAQGMRGIKMELLGCPTERAVYHPNVEVGCECAHARRAIVINHDWGPAERLLYLARKYPDACLITGHTSAENAAAARQAANLYMSTSPVNGYASVERFVALAGAEHIVFASDLSWDPVAWGLGPILFARIPLEAKRLILGGNIRRLLAQYPAGSAG